MRRGSKEWPGCAEKMREVDLKLLECGMRAEKEKKVNWFDASPGAWNLPTGMCLARSSVTALVIVAL